MKRLYAIALAGLLLATTTYAQTADEILAKYFEAIGQTKLNDKQVRTLTGSMMMGQMEAPITVYSKRPNKTRVVATFMGREITLRAFDGENGWRVSPRDMSVMAIAESELAELKEAADFDTPLYNYKSKGHSVELVGQEEFEGTPTYKLKLSLKSGNVSYYYFDAEAYVPIRIVSKRVFNGSEIESETLLSNYQTVDGILVSMSSESRALSGGPGGPGGRMGGGGGGKRTFSKADFATPIDDSVFAQPKQ